MDSSSQSSSLKPSIKKPHQSNPGPRTVGDYKCYYNIVDNTLQARMISKTSSGIFDWSFTEGEFKDHPILSFLCGSLNIFMEYVFSKPFTICENQDQNPSITVYFSSDMQKQRRQSLTFEIKRVEVTDNKKMQLQKDSLKQQLQKLSLIMAHALPSKQVPHINRVQFIPNSLEFSFSDFDVRTGVQSSSTSKVKKDREYSRLSNISSINKLANEHYYKFTISNYHEGNMLIGISAMHPGSNMGNMMQVPVNQTQVQTQVNLIALSLATLKAVNFIRRKISPMILNEKDQSIVAKLSKFVKEIEVEMLVNKEKKIVSWFFDGCFVDSASTILFPNESADQIYATIYFFNTNETVVFH